MRLEGGEKLFFLLNVFRGSILDGSDSLTEYLDAEVSIIETRETLPLRELIQRSADQDGVR